MIVRTVKPISPEVVPYLTKKGSIRVLFISAAGPQPQQGTFPRTAMLIGKALQCCMLIGIEAGNGR